MSVQNVDCCSVCGGPTQLVYPLLKDALFKSPGEWRMIRCIDTTCGALRLSPPPTPDQLREAYRTYPTHTDRAGGHSGRINCFFAKALRAYRLRRFGLPPAPMRLSDRFLAFLAGFPPLRVHFEFPLHLVGRPREGQLLELGCGGGETLRNLADWGWAVQGLDFDPAAVANARAKGLTVHEGDLASCTFQEGQFAVVFSNHVIEHLSSPREALAEIHRILEPGGCCILATPNAAGLGHAIFRSSWRGLEPPRHLTLFTPHAMLKLAEAAGFSCVELRTSSRLAFSMYLESRMARKGWFGHRRAPLGYKLEALAYYLMMLIWNAVSREAGEEIIFVGWKMP